MSTPQQSPQSREPLDKTEKILALQDELLNLRKEVSRKQSQWDKERSGLLSKIQISNIEIYELKQRIANFVKINETLSNAMTSQNEPQQSGPKTKKMKLVIGHQDSGSDSSGDKKASRASDETRRLNRIIQEKDFHIKNLSAMGNELRSKLEERNLVVGNLQQAVYTLRSRVQKKQQEILRAHQQIQQLESKLEQYSEYIQETRGKPSLPHQARQNQCEDLLDHLGQKKYQSKNSSYLIMKPTPDHSGYELDNNSSYINQIDMSEPDDNCQEEEKLLCEVCSRVFCIGEFEQHTKYCGYKAQESTRQLFERKREIEQKLQQIQLEEQKENHSRKYYKNQQLRLENQSRSHKDKINQIRQIASALPNKSRKNTYTDFSIKNNAYYH